MQRATDYLMSLRKTIKLYNLNLKEACKSYGLTQIEITIISFLHNNPGKDTAADIVELRMLSKGNVSQAVESLIKKSMLIRHPDEKDRRKIHLSLTSEALPLVEQVEKAKKTFLYQIFSGVTSEEYEQYILITDKIMNNIKNDLERKTSHHE